MNRIKEIKEYLLLNLGLNYHENQEKDLYRKLSEASLHFNFEQTDSFIDWLLSQPINIEQVEKLASFLTIGETYFFREKKALDYLECEYFPQLIQLRKSSKKQIKIWSAGCASGEEPYSIAILLKRIIPNIKDWNITILATDINPIFLEKAKKGIYSKWSFRGMSEKFKTDYFHKDDNNQYHIDQSFKEMVTFSYLNFVDNTYPSKENNTDNVDIILCRNVLIYFSADGIQNVTSKFYESLENNGVLLVSPVEVSPNISQKFNHYLYDGYTIYNKGAKKEIGTQLIVSQEKKSQTIIDFNKLFISTSKKIEKNEQIERQDNSILNHISESQTHITKPLEPQKEPLDYQNLLQLYHAGEFDKVESLIESMLIGNNNKNSAYILLLARIYANKGKLDKSEKLCMQAIELDKINEEAHYLMATILMEQGKVKEAKDSIHKALFLKPEFAMAHFMLGNIALNNGTKSVSKKHFNNAFLILKKLKPDDIIVESDGLTAGMLLQIIESMKI